MTSTHFDRLDPDHALRSSLEEIEALDTPLGHGVLRLMGVNPEVLAGGRRAADTVRGIQKGLVVAAAQLPRLGWIPFSKMPTEPYIAAGELAAVGRDDEAQDLLVECWNQEDRLHHSLKGVLALGAGGTPEQYANCQRRRELLERARIHHEAGAYEASIPIVFAHFDGVVHDLTGKSFFNNKNLLDDTTVAGHPEGLRVIAKVFGRDLNHTGSFGSVGRNGIMHGRELGYDNKLNSTKVFIGFLCLLEWAVPVAQAQHDAARQERTAINAGSNAVDEEGRRLDRREFDETKAALFKIYTSQEGWHRQRGAFRADLLDEIYDGDDFDGLPSNRGIMLVVSEAGQSWWAWRQTITGWCFAIGVSRPGEQWLYDGPEPPKGLPGQDASWGDRPFALDQAANW